MDRNDEVSNAFAAPRIKQSVAASFLAVAIPECITAVYALNKLGAAANTVDPRMDVNSNADYADAVQWAAANEVTKGSSTTTFSPESDCTRAQIVTFLYRSE